MDEGRYASTDAPGELAASAAAQTAGDQGALTFAPDDSPELAVTRASRPGRRRWVVPRRWHKFISVLSILAGLGLWQLFASTGVVNETLSSSPWQVLQQARLLFDNGTLGSDVLASAQLYALGLALSITIGIIVGIIIGWWLTLGAIFDPWVAVMYSTPLIASMPLLIAWFGIGFESQVVMVILVSVFPLLVNVIVGSRQVDANLLKMARSFGASQPAVLRSLVLPSLVPYIVTGVRIAVGAGLVGVVISEYFEGSDGIGGMILNAGQQLNSAGVFLGLVILAGTALTLTSGIRTLERRVSSWREG